MMDSILIFTDCCEAVCDLTDSDAGVLFKALLRYGAGKGVDLEDITYGALPMFKILKGQIDRAEIKHLETIERRSEAGKKGGIASGESRRKQAEANASKAKQNEAKRSNASKREANASKTKLPNPNPNPNPNRFYTHNACACEEDGFDDIKEALME